MANLNSFIPWTDTASSTGREPQVTLYTKAGCHLCEDAHEVLMAVRADRPFAFEEVDITTDDTLMATYGELIPVVLIDGRERFRYRINEKRLRRELHR